MSASPERHYVDVDGREVHVRVAGRGAPVLLIHECPRSSETLLALLEAVAHDRRAIAIDLPGFGNSEPLAIELPTIDDFADAVARTLEVLGVARCAVYGMHTGAKVALALALRRPEVVAGLVLDGLSVNPPNASMVAGEGYLAGYVPRQDGAHVAELWCRERDQYRFYPWCTHTRATRLPWALPEPATIQAHMLDLLRAGPEFGRRYLAPYRYSGADAIVQVTVPTEIVCRRDDLLHSHLERLPALPPVCRATSLPPDGWLAHVVGALLEASTALPEALVAMTGTGAGARAVAPRLSRTDPRRRRHFVSTTSGRVSVHEYGPSAAPATVLVIPDVPGGAGGGAADGLRLGERARVLVPELPGCGDSDPLGERSLGGIPVAEDAVRADREVRHGEEVRTGREPRADEALLDATADALADVCRALATAPVVVHATGYGAALAATLAQRHPGLVARLVLDGVGLVDAADRADAVAHLPDLTPTIAGEHALRAWHFLRDQSLAWPWWEPSARAVRRLDPALDADLLHARWVDLMKQPSACLSLWRALMAADPVRALEGVRVPIVFLTHPDDPAYRDVPRAASAVGGATTLVRSGESAGGLDALRSVLDASR